MRIAQLSAGVLEWPPRYRGEPQGSEPLETRQPRMVGHRMPFVQLGVRGDDLRVLHYSFAEVVTDGGDGEDATQTFIQRWLCHDFVLPWVCVLTGPRIPRGQSVNDHASLCSRSSPPIG